LFPFRGVPVVSADRSSSFAMSGRIEKRRSGRSSLKTSQSLLLASTILARAVEMAPCSSCARRGSSCLVSDSDSSRCSECVRRKVGDCDIYGPSHNQLRKLASTQICLEADLEAASDEVEKAQQLLVAAHGRFRRVQAQKRLWSAKVARAVERGLDDLEELEALEHREEEENRSSEAAAATVDTAAASALPETAAAAVSSAAVPAGESCPRSLVLLPVVTD
jgi:hypothetical protein